VNDADHDVRIMLLDDHSTFRQPLAFLLGQEPGLSVIAQAGTLAEARAALEDDDLKVDVAIVDLDLPDGSGADFVRELRTLRPKAMALILSAYADANMLARAIEAEAAGVLHKSAKLEDVLEALHRLRTGEQLLSSQEIIEALRLISQERQKSGEARLRISKLTPREHEVLQALADGLSDKEIADRLYVGIGTVRTHMASILSKLELQSRLQALVFAVRHDLVEIR